MHYPQRSIQPRFAATACLAILLSGSAASAAEPPSKPAFLTVLDEACVDRRVEMCLRLADPNSSTAIESSLEQLCPSIACERGWYRTDLGRYGRLGPLCVCERRYVGVADGQRCAEGFKETSRVGPDGTARIACELPEMKMEQDQGRWEWPATPWDLVTCLQFARFGPGSSLCRKSVPAKGN